MATPKSNPEPNFVMAAPDPATQSVERLRRQALRLLTEARGDDGAHEAPPASGPSGAPAPSSAPSMIVGVMAMPAVFLAIVLVALAVFGKPGEDAPPVAATPVAAAPPALPLAAALPAARGAIALPDDARIEAIALDGDRVALHVEGPAGHEIIIYDYREGRQLAAATIETASTEATDTLSTLTGPPPAPAITGAPRLKPRSTP